MVIHVFDKRVDFFEFRPGELLRQRELTPQLLDGQVFNFNRRLVGENNLNQQFERPFVLELLKSLDMPLYFLGQEPSDLGNNAP